MYQGDDSLAPGGAPTPQDLDELEREIERLTRESREALAVVEEIYGDTRPDMLVMPRREP